MATRNGQPVVHRAKPPESFRPGEIVEGGAERLGFVRQERREKLVRERVLQAPEPGYERVDLLGELYLCLEVPGALDRHWFGEESLVCLREMPGFEADDFDEELKSRVRIDLNRVAAQSAIPWARACHHSGIHPPGDFDWQVDVAASLAVIGAGTEEKHARMPARGLRPSCCYPHCREKWESAEIELPVQGARCLTSRADRRMRTS